MKLWIISGLIVAAGVGTVVAFSSMTAAEAEGTTLGKVYTGAQEPEANLTIGEPFDRARQMLLDGGFEAVNPMSDGCVFQKDDGDTVKITLSTGSGRCEQGMALAFIRYTHTERQAQPDAMAELKLVSDSMGVDGNCRLATARTAFCNWNDPGAFPDLVEVDLTVQGRVTNVSLRTYVGADPERTPSPRNDVAVDGGPAPSANLGAFDPRASFGDLDPRAPNGVRIGAPLNEVAEKLLQAGFTTPDGGRMDKIGCGWRFRRQNEVDVRIDLRAEVTVDGRSRTDCVDGAVIKTISFNKTDSRLGSGAKGGTPAEMIDRWRSLLGASEEGEDCKITQNGAFERAQCTWKTVSAVPVEYATVTYHFRSENNASAAVVLKGLP